MRHRTDGQGLFTLETGIDAANAVVDEYDKKNEGKKKKSGLYRYPRPVDEQGNPRELTGLLRESYFRGSAVPGPAQVDDDPLAGLIDRQRPPGGYNPSEYGDPV